jgi:hypothetical protein
LSAFQGAAIQRSDGAISVQPAEIKRKSIVLVIPANAEQSWLDSIFNEITNYAEVRRISIWIERYGQSNRYDQDKQDRLVTSAGLRYHFNVAA